MARIGYARVSSADQNHELQIARLEQAGCSPIRSEKVSGKDREGRGELAAVLDFVRFGDEVVVVRLDRLGRNTRDILNIVHELEAKGASLRVLEPDISTAGEVGSILITVLGMVAEIERRFIRERQQSGIEAAKARGVYKGRKKGVDVALITTLKAEGLGASEIAKKLGISRTSVYRSFA